MEITEHIVRFDEYCHKCEYLTKKTWEEPCHDCLSCPTNTNSRQPVYFKEVNKYEN